MNTAYIWVQRFFLKASNLFYLYSKRPRLIGYAVTITQYFEFSSYNTHIRTEIFVILSNNKLTSL